MGCIGSSEKHPSTVLPEMVENEFSSKPDTASIENVAGNSSAQ